MELVGSAWLRNQRFVFTPKKKYTQKIIFLTIQLNTNLDMFPDEILVKKKKDFDERWLFFRKKRVTKISRSNIKLAYFSISKGYFQSF